MNEELWKTRGEIPNPSRRKEEKINSVLDMARLRSWWDFWVKMSEKLLNSKILGPKRER